MAPAIPRVAIDQYRALLDELDRAWQRRGEGGACTPGCAACCVGPFDVGPADVWLALEALEQLDPKARRNVMQRIARSSAAEREHFGGAPPSIDVDERRFDEMCAALAEAECPFLLDVKCSIYDDRPQPCRLMGASWGPGATQLELPCPIDLTTGEPRIGFDFEGHELALARHESRTPAPRGWTGRTTLASALDALLRGAHV